MQIAATEKVTIRTRPVPQAPTRPKAEILTTHAGICSLCGAESRLGLSEDAGTVYGSCRHFEGIVQQGAAVMIHFRAA